MKKTCCTLLCAGLLAVTSTGVQAADVTVDSSTLLGIGTRDVSGTSKETLLPATQFLGLTADKLADGNLSLHFYGWGRADLADKSFNNDQTAGSLTYGYLQYRFKQANANIRAGRLFVHEGIVNEQIDGISARTDLPLGFSLSAFGGATVHTAHLSGETSDGKGDTLYGGRANYRYKGLLEIGLSGVYEGAAPTLVTHTVGDYRRVGGDIWITPVKTIDIIGHSSYNPETQQIAEHSYLLNVKPIQHLVLTGEFNQHREQSFLLPWTTFSATLLTPNDKSSSVGGSASYEVNKNFEVAGDYKHYTREFGSAARYGGDARVNFKDNTIRGGIGYHYLNAGEGFAIVPNISASYHEARCYAMQDTKSYFAAIDLLGDFFKEKIYDKSSAWEATTSLGYHLTPALALSGDVSYGRNPQFTEEVKALLRLTYNMTYTGIGGKK
jgi:opacity protein-like surface antigen